VIDLIGGLANADEFNLKKPDDLRKFMIKEVKEETNFKISISKIRLFGICLFNQKYQFVYVFKVPCHSKNKSKYSKKGEFSSLITLSEKDLIRRKGGSSFEYCKNYIHLIKETVKK
jgi:hypothetical protein